MWKVKIPFDRNSSFFKSSFCSLFFMQVKRKLKQTSKRFKTNNKNITNSEKHCGTFPSLLICTFVWNVFDDDWNPLYCINIAKIKAKIQNIHTSLFVFFIWNLIHSFLLAKTIYDTYSVRWHAAPPAS